MSRCHATVEIAASPDRVFPYLYESTKLARWVRGLMETKPVLTTEPRVGSRMTAVYEVRGRRYEAESETTRIESGRLLEGRSTGLVSTPSESNSRGSTAERG